MKTIGVIKRDGAIVDFSSSKILTAVLKACEEAEMDFRTMMSVAGEVTTKVVTEVTEKKIEAVAIETIQDLVVKHLWDLSPGVAKGYVAYRECRDKVRDKEKYKNYMSIMGAENNEITRENANMNADTPAGMMMKYASETTKAFTESCLLSDEVKEFKGGNLIHVHDQDYYPTKSTTCVQHPLDNILENGFRAGHGASRPAKRIETASILGCISLETSQNEQHGGQAIPSFDHFLAKYVKLSYFKELRKSSKLLGVALDPTANYLPKEYIEEDIEGLEGIDRVIQDAVNNTWIDTYQAMEAFIHNMNTIHSRGGNQVVFSSINYGTNKTPEGRCIIRALLLSTWRGVGDDETPIFPIQIFKLKEGINVNPEDPNYDLFKLACEVTAKRFFPTFLNLDATFNQHEDWDINDPERYKYELDTMGCRTRVFENRHGEKTSIGRGNLSFTTVNLVKLALISSDVEDFYCRLGKAVDVVAEQLYDRFKFQSTATAKQFPLLMSSLWKGGDALSPNDTIGEVLKQGTLGVGFIGLAECLVALTGKHHGECLESQRLGLNIIKFMQTRVNLHGDNYNLNYSLLATPAEGLSGKFTAKDKKEFGIIPGVTDRDYYTNSSHIPVHYKCTIEHKIKTEAPYQEMCRGGHILYVELDGDGTHNVEAVEKVIKLMRKHNVGYGAVNHDRKRCLECGYEDANPELVECPRCGSSNLDTLQRITGYLVGTTDRWNNGKKSELKDRVTHN